MRNAAGANRTISVSPACVVLAWLGCAVGAAEALAADWPGFRGPNHNGVSLETGGFDAWPEGGKPPVAWKASVGKGHSAVVVAGGRAFTMGWDGRQDTVWCFDAASGAVTWKVSYPCGERNAESGPRSTPAVDADTVYTLSQNGHLRATEVAGGRERWHVNLPETCAPDKDYGHCWSPLLLGDLVILGGGRAGLAFRKSTGQKAWGDPAGRGANASAVPYDDGGRRGVVVASTDGKTVDVVGVNPDGGAELWRFPGWPEPWGNINACPVVLQGKVFITSGQSHHGGARLSFAGGKAVKDWESRALGSNTGQCVLLDGHVYGVDCSRGTLVCVKWDDGSKVWEQKGFGNFGSLMAADGRLIVMGSNGGLVVAQASPQGYRELRRFDGVVGRTFTAPVLANGRLYCRDYEGQVVCLATGGK